MYESHFVNGSEAVGGPVGARIAGEFDKASVLARNAGSNGAEPWHRRLSLTWHRRLSLTKCHSSLCKVWIGLIVAALVAGCNQESAPETTLSENDSENDTSLESGIDLAGMDTSVRPQDNFFAYANGTWVKNTEIPADQSGWGSFNILYDTGLGQLRDIIEDVSQDAGNNDAAGKIGNFYKAWLDTQQADAKGVKPLTDLFARIDALKNYDEVVAFFGATNELGLDAPFNLFISQDEKAPDRYVVITWQSGLGLPDRDYYFDDSERGQELRDQYVQYVQKVMALSGYDDSEGAAKRIMALETKLAEHQWTKVENRDANKRYNKVPRAEFTEMLSNFDLDAWFKGIGTGRQDYVIVSQPSYMTAMNDIFPTVDLATWKEFLRLQVLTSYADYLSQDFVAAHFDFYGRTLQGKEEQLPRWKRAIDSINDNLGELLGQLYVERYFPPEAKERMVEMVDNLIAAYRESIQNLDWMSDETKNKALKKLSMFTPKIGYPDKWKDYSGLKVSSDDLVGNVQRARTLNHYREIDKLGKPVDRDEWFMNPQTVNAYYNPPMNEIVFPAAILQPPFFILESDDARNYGAIGLVIGHEIGHGFDDQGSKYMGDGTLANWWTDADRTRFEKRTKALVEQYNGFEALPGLFVNGELTLGENIGDLGGAAIALRAYELSLDGKEAPVIDGMTGRERFFLGFAQVWRSKYRPEATELRVKSDPHSPAIFRVNGVLPNLDAFYETFNVTEGDDLYLPPAERVHIWR